MTVADSDTLAEIGSVLHGVPVDTTPRLHRIEFAYDTPLSPPRLRMHKSDQGIYVPDVNTDDAVVFGMVEAQPAVTARRAIVDPQHSLSLDQAAETIVADELVIVANLSEILDLTHSRDLDIAVDTILSRTGAAGVVVKAGALGALVFQPGVEAEGIPAFVTPTVFPIGSGDVFTAALAAHYFDSGNLVAAAHSASRRTAGYVTVRHLGVVDLGNNIKATVVPTVRSVQDPPKVYIAASFANPEQVWSGRTVDRGIRDIGGRSIYPPREVGEKQDAETTARADLENLDACDAVILLADVARTGPFFEAGWATCRGIPVVVMNSDLDPDRFTMLKGTGADLVSDLATAAYRSVWAALEHRDSRALAGRLMLLSGGLDSVAVAAVEGATHALFIDYGQTPAEAEWAAAQAVARHLCLDIERLSVDLSNVGSGLLASTAQMPVGPTPEWFPFRNQFLVTIAAAHAAKHGFGAVLLGVVAGDGDRHSDGTAGFVSTLDLLVRDQEGCVRVLAPQIKTHSLELLRRSNLPQEVLRQTHSCHASNDPCGECPGCRRRDEILAAVFPPTT